MEPLQHARLSGSVALVTGASRGIGAAVACVLAGLGAHVIIAARDDSGLVSTDDAIRDAGGEATLLPADLTRADVVDAIGANVYDRFGRLDIMVHAAAVCGAQVPAGQIEDGEWERVIGLDATATWRLIRTTEPLLRAAPHGRVVVMTHPVASAPRACWGAFAAGMAARQAFVQCWAQELERTSLRVNLVQGIEENAQDAMALAIAAMCLPGETRHGTLVSFD